MLKYFPDELTLLILEALLEWRTDEDEDEINEVNVGHSASRGNSGHCDRRRVPLPPLLKGSGLRALAKICLTSKHMRELAEPLLYRSSTKPASRTGPTRCLAYGRLAVRVDIERFAGSDHG